MKLEFYEQEGNFNWSDTSDCETQWYVTLKNEDGSIVERDGHRCRLYWSEKGDERGRYSMEDSLESLAELSFNYACKVWSTVDYKSQTLAFIQTYNEHREEISQQFEEKRKLAIQKDIERLQNKLEETVLDGKYDLDISSITHSEQKRLKSWIASSEEELSQYKENTPLYEKTMEKITKYKNELEKYIV